MLNDNDHRITGGTINRYNHSNPTERTKNERYHVQLQMLSGLQISLQLRDNECSVQM